MPASLENFKERVQKWDERAAHYRELGAEDTEPQFKFQAVLVDHFKGTHNPDDTPITASDWELYSSEKGASTAARSLTSKLKSCLKAMDRVPNKDRESLEAYIEEYCYRCYY